MGTVSIVSHIKSTQALTKVIVDEIDNVALATVNSMSSWINDRVLDVDNWSKQGVYQKALLSSFLGMTTRSFANDQLSRIKKDYGYYEDIVLADNSGDIVAASDPDVIGKINVSDRVYFQKALAGKPYVTEHVLKSKIDGKLVAMVSAPVMDKNNIVGVLFAVFDVKSLVGKFIDSIRIGNHGFAFVFLEKGYIVCNNTKPEFCGGNISAFKFGGQMMKEPSGSLDYNLDGVRMTASFKRLEKMKWTIVVCAVKDELFLPVKTLGRINSFVTFVVALVVGFVIVLVTLSISRPIKEVVEGLKQMGKGHLDYRLTIKNKDEIGRIGEALNRMARNLEVSDKKIKEQNELLTQARDELEQRVEQRTWALKQAENKYRGIFENAVEGIFQATLNGQIINANPSLAKILGYPSVSQMFAKDTAFFFPVSKKEGQKIKQALEKDGEVVAWETQLKRKEGNRFWCSVSASVILNEKTGTKYCEGFVVDISERREKERAQSEYKAAKAASRAKSEFLANMSHEIRTPLNTLLGFSELLAVDLNDPKQESYIEAMRVAGNSLLTLINDILDLSKIEAGKMEFRYEPVNFKTLCSEILYIFKEKMETKGIRLDILISEQFPDAVLLDETRMRQVLLNLVGNAVKFTQEGFITLKAECVNTDDSRFIDLIITVEDTGPGIDPEFQDVIFESFKQADGQINRKHGGTGLGLAICKRLIQAMNGEISVKSRPTEGSVFTVLLKNVAGAEEGALPGSEFVPKEKKGPARFEKNRVLIVDDIASNRIMLKELLLRFNQDVSEAMDGIQAIEMAKTQKPDLIIMDIRMPVMDGNDATKKLKADPETKMIPIIAFTGDVVAKTKTGALKKGYDGYLTKPVKIDALTRELGKHITPEDRPGNTTEKKADFDGLSREDVKEPEKLLSILQEKILPSSKFYQSSIVINQVKEFSNELNLLSKNHQVTPLTVFSEQLIHAVNLFDITRIEKKMDELPGLLEKLIQKL